MPSGWNPGAGTAAITHTLAYGKYGSPNNAMVMLVCYPPGARLRTGFHANEVRLRDRMSPFSRTKFAQATGCRRAGTSARNAHAGPPRALGQSPDVRGADRAQPEDP